MSFVATPTKTPLETAARALQLIQKTNSWTQGTDLVQNKDDQGKIRSSFCLRGAIRAAIGGETKAALNAPRTLRLDRLARATNRAILKTVNANPKRYGVEEKITSVITFNDNNEIEHRHVVRALRDTVTALTPADTIGCGS